MTVIQAPVLALAMAALAPGQAPTKIGIINIQGAIVQTKDGQKAAAELQAKFDPTRKELERKQAEIATLRDRMQKGSNTLSDAQKNQLARDIDSKTRVLNRDTEDAQTEFDQAQQKLLQDLGQKMMAVMGKYAQDKGYAVILDVSSPQTPVLYAADHVEITADIVALYDKNSPGAASAPAAAQSKPASSVPATGLRPVVPPAAKKK